MTTRSMVVGAADRHSKMQLLAKSVAMPSVFLVSAPI